MGGSATGLLMCSATVPDLRHAAAEWCEASGYQEIARYPVGAELAGLWGVEAGAHHEAVVSAVPGTGRGFVRWIDTRHVTGRVAQVDYPGPFALEFFARDVDAVYDRFAQCQALRPLSVPVTYNLEAIGSGTCRSFAIRGPGDVWLFITTMLSVPPPRQLPVTPHFVAPVINMPIAGTARDPLVALYHDLLGIPIRFDGDVADADVNAIMGAPPDWAFRITVFFLGDGQLCEQHIHPAQRLAADPTPAGVLRSGPAIETLVVSDLDSIAARAREAGRAVRGPVRLDVPPYSGHRVACLDGVNGELLELVQA